MDSNDSALEYNLPRNPDEQIRIALQVIQRAYHEKVESIQFETEQLRVLIKEKQKDFVELRSSVEQLREDVSRKDLTIKQITEENENLGSEKSVLLQQIRRLNRELSKLSSFKKAIIKSINQDSLEDLSTSTVDEYNTSPLSKSSKIFESYDSYSGSNMESQDQSSRSGKLEEEEDKTFRKGIIKSGTPSSSVGPSKQLEGREFFKMAKNRLSQKQFSLFLNCIKNLNQRQQTKEETIAIAREIFGNENQDLFSAFQNILVKHIDEKLEQ